MPNPDCGYLPWEEVDQDLASDRECYYFLGGPFSECTCGDILFGQPCPYQGQPEKENGAPAP